MNMFYVKHLEKFSENAYVRILLVISREKLITLLEDMIWSLKTT